MQIVHTKESVGLHVVYFLIHQQEFEHRQNIQVDLIFNKTFDAEDNNKVDSIKYPSLQMDKSVCVKKSGVVGETFHGRTRNLVKMPKNAKGRTKM